MTETTPPDPERIAAAREAFRRILNGDDPELNTELQAALSEAVKDDLIEGIKRLAPEFVKSLVSLEKEDKAGGSPTGLAGLLATLIIKAQEDSAALTQESTALREELTLVREDVAKDNEARIQDIAAIRNISDELCQLKKDLVRETGRARGGWILSLLLVIGFIGGTLYWNNQQILTFATQPGTPTATIQAPLEIVAGKVSEEWQEGDDEEGWLPKIEIWSNDPSRNFAQAKVYFKMRNAYEGAHDQRFSIHHMAVRNDVDLNITINRHRREDADVKIWAPQIVPIGQRP